MDDPRQPAATLTSLDMLTAVAPESPVVMQSLLRDGGMVRLGQSPPPGPLHPGDVLIRVVVAGICRTDLYVADGRIRCAAMAVLRAGLQPGQRGLIWGSGRIAELTRRILAAHGLEVPIHDAHAPTLPEPGRHDFIIETVALSLSEGAAR